MFKVGSQSLPEPVEEDFSTVSGEPPPVIVSAFPDYGYEQKPPPGHDIGSPSIPWPTIVAVVAVSIAVIVVAVAITLGLTRRGGPNPSPAPSTTSTTSSATTATQALPSTVTVTAPPPVTVTAPPPVTVTAPPPSRPTYPVPPNPQSVCLQQLRGQSDIDYLAVTPWAKNLWVPQLSSKHPGTVDDGIRWDCNSIWQEHLRLRQLYGAQLLWSGDWPNTFKNPDYWVTIAGFTFRDADGAREWCQNHGRDSHHCFPTQIQ
jgi:hypothetical protein